MNTAFTNLPSKKYLTNSGNTATGYLGNTDKVKVNVVDDWTRKKKRMDQNEAEIKHNMTEETNADKSRRLKSFNIYLTSEDGVESVNEYNDTLPENVECTYKYDFNLMDVHNLIVKKFDRQKRHEIKDLEKLLIREKDKLKERQNIVERKDTLRNIKKIEERIATIKSNTGFQSYTEKIDPLLKEYNIIGALSKIVSFASNKKKEEEDEVVPENEEVQEKRHQVILDYLEIARKYMDLDVVREVKAGNICQTCNYKLEEIMTNDPDENGLVICPNCDTEKIAIVRSRFYKDNTRTNNSGNNYEDRKNFVKALMRYQGKQHDKPGSDLYVVLEKYFNDKQLPKIDINGNSVYISPAEIKKLPLNKDGEKDGTSRLLMFKALKETDNKQGYDHINIILHEFWGWKLDDISHLEEQIMNDYDDSQRVYEVLPKDRTSSLNSQFRLFKHLRRLRHPCRSRNFRIPTTPDILEFHENMWAKMADVLDWENP